MAGDLPPAAPRVQRTDRRRREQRTAPQTPERGGREVAATTTRPAEPRSTETPETR